MNFHPLITIAVVLFFGYLAFLAIRKIRRDNAVNVVEEPITEDEKTLTDLLYEAAEVDPAGDVDNPGSDAAILEKGIVDSDFETLKGLQEQGVLIPAKAWEDLANNIAEHAYKAKDENIEEQRAEAAKEFDSVLTDAPVASTTEAYADAVEYKKAPKKAKKAVEIPESKKPANAKFTDANIREIRKLYETAGHDITTLSILFDASPRTIDRIVKRQTYAQVV